jgi:hypothetical protein
MSRESSQINKLEVFGLFLHPSLNKGNGLLTTFRFNDFGDILLEDVSFDDDLFDDILFGDVSFGDIWLEDASFDDDLFDDDLFDDILFGDVSFGDILFNEISFWGDLWTEFLAGEVAAAVAVVVCVVKAFRLQKKMQIKDWNLWTKECMLSNKKLKFVKKKHVTVFK